MVDDRFIEIVRTKAYPIDVPEGPEYEKARVREVLDAIGGFRRGKPNHGLAIQAARDEAAVVLRACFAAQFGEVPDRVLEAFP
jgi:hypothetical protein